MTNAPRFVADAYSFRIQNILRRDLERLYLYDADVVDGRSATDFIGNDSSILISRSLINSGIANSNYYNISAAQRLEANALADIISGRTRCYTTLANLAGDTSTYSVVLGIAVAVAVLLCGYFVVSYLTRPDTVVDAVAGSVSNEATEASRNVVSEVVLERPDVESVTIVLGAVPVNPEYVLAGSLLGCTVFVVYVLVLFVGRCNRI